MIPAPVAAITSWTKHAIDVMIDIVINDIICSSSSQSQQLSGVVLLAVA